MQAKRLERLKWADPSPVDFSWDEDEQGNLIDERAREFEAELEELRSRQKPLGVLLVKASR